MFSDPRLYRQPTQVGIVYYSNALRQLKYFEFRGVFNENMVGVGEKGGGGTPHPRAFTTDYNPILKKVPHFPDIHPELFGRMVFWVV